MAGRKPDYRLCFVEEVKGKKVWHKIGSGWKNDSSIGIQVNAGLPVTLPPNTKLVLVENTENGNGEAEGDTSFDQK